MNVKLYHDLSSVHLDDMQKVYASVGWMKHNQDIIKRIFDASTHVSIAVGGKCGDEVIGFGRALSDGYFNAALYDVIVHADYQGKGIGRIVIDDLLHQLRDVSCVHLISTTGRDGFYHRAGMRKVKTAMARYLDPVLTDEYLE